MSSATLALSSASSTAATTTLRPCRARRSTMARPMPEEPPCVCVFFFFFWVGARGERRRWVVGRWDGVGDVGVRRLDRSGQSRSHQPSLHGRITTLLLHCD